MSVKHARSKLCAAVVAGVLLCLASTAQARGVVETIRRLHKLGLSIPAWFVAPETPFREGDGRPATPLVETVSSMLLLKVAKDGRPSSCEILMTNGSADLANSFCSRSLETMRFEASNRKIEKAFWVHAHQDSATNDMRVTFVNLPIKN